MEARVVKFDVASPGGRLDRILVDRLREFSRNRVQTWIRNSNVLVDGQIVTKTGFALAGGESVQVRIPRTKPSDLIPEAIPLQILFENDDLLVIDKSAGIVVHPSVGHSSGTLVHAVLAHIPDIEGIGGEKRPGVVHRLDKETSGVILFAKNDIAHQFLQDQFKSHKVAKTYLTLVDGHPPTPSGRIEGAIGRDPKHRQRMAVVPDSRGKAAVTVYHVIESFPEHALLEVHPETGRTHQIRVHAAFLGCPVVGDRVYGRRKPSLPAERHLLHAARLEIELPSEPGRHTFEAPLPGDMSEILNRLRAA